ncbi:para-aminobenzoate synthetase component 1 [Belliella buryatensis]|uniref:Para-aminobenzoate synthetase component 1 n=1 Tax=Belliella buryatensis TaxID=1500549 RepID=A0A239CIJ5_9BACT|nr:anthranilate synthase component I family protein [Belliella buryatensis]SNS19960.1 para-aminobenzoate synthetase component 1 [Belliella buryatensis]
MIQTFNLPTREHADWIKNLLSWASNQYPYFAFFENHQVNYPYDGFKKSFFAGSSCFNLDQASVYYKKSEMVGILSYDFKNQIEKLASDNRSLVDLPDTLFFLPDVKVLFHENSIEIESNEPENIFWQIVAFQCTAQINPSIQVRQLTSKEAYIEAVKAIQNHILEGDIYELNYCMAFDFKADWNPVQGFFDLTKRSAMPFSALFKAESSYLVCASPERFLKVADSKIIAQPIKGTIRRGKDGNEDLALSKELLHSEKERAENLMIVDLMRNDLSKIAETGSVQVEELFGVYAFPKVFQMISTVSAELKASLNLKEMIHATFPMGSMTGAPKIKCMELIDCYENFKRGWFSGTVGYIHPNGDLDMNVIIRSIIYDQRAQKGYFAVGSAITYDADAAYEYEECFLKASAILETLQSESSSKM